MEVKKTKIFMTVGRRCKDKNNPIFQMVEKNLIGGLRFNLAKCNDDKDLLERISFIRNIKTQYPNVEIMLDIPYPGSKFRMQILKTDKIWVEKKQIIEFYFEVPYNKKNINPYTIQIPYLNFFQNAKLHQHLIYSDGECILEIISLNSNFIQARALNGAWLYSGKSIYSGVINKKDSMEMYIKAIDEINPHYLALSFITCREEISSCIERLGNRSIEIISKIECQQAVMNIDSLAKVSDIMLARGDLLLNTPYEQFLNYQEKIALSANKNTRKLFCATGILKGLFQGGIVPSQADVIDLSILLSYKPYALILNYPEHKLDSCYVAFEIIRRINDMVYEIK